MNTKQIATCVFVLIIDYIGCHRRLSLDVINIEILHENLGPSTEKIYKCITTGFPILLNNQKQQVRKIDIYNQTIPVLEEETINNFNRLEKVNFIGNNITKIKTATFNKLPSLKYVKLSDNKIITIQFGIFIEVPKLLHLHLDKNRLTNFKQAWLGYVPTLKLLNLKSNLLEIITTGSFSSFPNLFYINLGHNRIHHIEEDAFYGLERLEILDLSYNKIKHLYDDLFIPVRDLHILNLYHNQLTYISDQLLENMTNLRELISLFNPWQVGCFEKLEKWAANKSVRLNKNKYFKCARVKDVNNIPKCVILEDNNNKDCLPNHKENLTEILYSLVNDYECDFEYEKYFNL